MGFMTETMRQRAEEFVRNWTGRGDEDSDTQQYWIDLLENVIQVPDVRDRDVAWFERRTASGGKIDLYCGEARFLVEQKSLGVDLDKPAERQHRMVTPVQQALSYANALPASQRPDRIIVCPFDRFRIYNLETDPLCERPAAEFTLDELPANIGLLAGLFDLNRSRVTIQKRLSREAGVLAARLPKGTLAPDLSTVHYGSMPLDGGSLLITTREEYERGMSDPIAARYIRPFLMGKQFINGIRNWCLWLVDAEPQEMRESHFISERVRMCREDREHSRPGTDKYKHRNTPWLFRDDHQPREPYLAIPEVFTRRRRYATCGFCPPNVIAGSKIYVCEDPDLVNFSIIESSMFITWQMSIGGKNKSDPSFANTIVWNTLPLPRMDDALRRSVCEKGRGVLDARAAHPGQSLADLYDPDFMPPDLADAHRELDKIVDVAFGAGKWLGEDNEARMQVLYDRYTEMTGMGR